MLNIYGFLAVPRSHDLETTRVYVKPHPNCSGPDGNELNYICTALVRSPPLYGYVECDSDRVEWDPNTSYVSISTTAPCSITNSTRTVVTDPCWSNTELTDKDNIQSARN